MIISHQFKLIFIKTKKVGGTSFEIALSRFLDDDDIITPISEDDEILRGDLGYKQAKNYEQNNRLGYGIKNHPNEFISGDFKHHISADNIYKQIGSNLFNGYTKISIHRNPLDLMVSHYFWRNRNCNENTRSPFNKWVKSHLKYASANYRIAPVTGPYSIDHIIRYESLQEDILNVAELPAGFSETFNSIRAKANTRPCESRDPGKYFCDNNARELIEVVLNAANNHQGV